MPEPLKDEDRQEVGGCVELIMSYVEANLDPEKYEVVAEEDEETGFPVFRMRYAEEVADA